MDRKIAGAEFLYTITRVKLIKHESYLNIGCITALYSGNVITLQLTLVTY